LLGIVLAWLAIRREGPTDAELCRGETLMRSACQTLVHTPWALIEAVTLSLPASGSVAIGELKMIARVLADDHQLDAALTVGENRIAVRLSRKHPSGGAQ